MEGKLLKEIDYLTRLIEQHKQTSKKMLSTEDISDFCTQSLYSGKSKAFVNPLQDSLFLRKLQVQHSNNGGYAKETVTKVHVNPNFKSQNTAIHINPKIRSKPQIHVNPKMMGDVTNSNNNKATRMNNAVPIKSQTVRTNIKRSVYVSPELMTKLSSTTENKIINNKSVTKADERIDCLRIKPDDSFLRSSNDANNTSNSDIIVLSQRKLIRTSASKNVSSNPQTTYCRLKMLSQSSFRKTRIVSSKIITNPPKLYTNSEVGRYKIDRTFQQVVKVKKNYTPIMKYVRNTTMDLVTIGGIMYKSSRNQLVRNSPPIKKKRIGSLKKDKFIVSANGKKLYQQKVNRVILNRVVANTPRSNMDGPLKRESSSLMKLNHKNILSNKVKQRSIQILRNKMRKNNQPCLLYQKFGFCANHKKGICSKLHDKKQVSICRRFLQGKCLLDNCPLSHDVGPEKMPTCKYFLEGCCTRDACPYHHVKVSSNCSICIQFLQGYCAEGNKCKHRHEYVCPEFDKLGKCRKGKYCPYPHKSHASPNTRTNKHLHKRGKVPKVSKKQTVPASSNALSCASCPSREGRLRYYEESEASCEDTQKRREHVMRQVNIMKNINIVTEENAITVAPVNNDSTLNAETPQSKDIESCSQLSSKSNLPKRRPIGSLPAYIPID